MRFCWLAICASACASAAEREPPMPTLEPGVEPVAGGQSGTDQNSEACITTSRAAAFDENTALELSGRQVLAALEQTLAERAPPRLSWRLPVLGGESDLAIEPSDRGEEVVVLDSEEAGCRGLAFDLRLHASSSDGVLDAVFEGSLRGWRAAGAGGASGWAFSGVAADAAQLGGTLRETFAAASHNGPLEELSFTLDARPERDGDATLLFGGGLWSSPEPMPSSDAPAGASSRLATIR